jgi:serine phosphatase RsbU (regulator of sigma subunit)
VSTVVVFTMMGLFGLLLLVAYVLTYRRLMTGMTALRTGTEIVGRGNLDHVIPDDQRDEIGDLSRAFNAMTADLKNVTASRTRLEQEIAERKQAQAEREQLLVRQEELAESLALVNEELQVQNEELRVTEEHTARLLAERNSLFERLQTAFLHIPTELPGVRFSHLYHSATSEAQVGGDFYDVFETRDRRVGLLVGDVSGHGIEAARVATLVKDTVHAFTHMFRHPHLVLRETNRLLVERNLTGFVTAFLAFLEPASGVLRYASAGHPPPLLMADGDVIPLESASLPLGVFADARYADSEAVVPTGSLLVLYTDGITEARTGSLLFGEDGLRGSLSRASHVGVEGLPAFLLAEALRFSHGRLGDDVAILAVSYEGSAANVGPTPA